MKTFLRIAYILLLLVIGTICILAQSKQLFRVESFGLDQFDMTARNEAFKEVDGNGSLYAIIKVTSSTPNDDLSAYNFNFGNMNSKLKMKDGELWVYVQRNAKMVTISRNGYETINKYDLQTTIEEGRTYTMRLSTQAAKVYTQMVLFKVSPADSKAMISIQSETDGVKQLLGTSDAEGLFGKVLPVGSYTYEVLAEGYYPSEGRFTLNDPKQRHEESVMLRPRFSEISLTVNADADIYVNGERMGNRFWQGRLNPGSYQVECRKANHKPSMQVIQVEENSPQSITLQAPEPITGSLSVLSNPLNASILIDGTEVGNTPLIINDLLIGPHRLTLRKSGYDNVTQTITVKEGETLETSLVMNATKKPVTTSSTSVVNNGSTPDDSQNPNIQTFTVTGNGKTVTFRMVKVEAGRFQMGSNSGEDDEKPVRWVTIDHDYYMGETEVTQALWYAVMGQSSASNSSKWTDGQGDDYPAYCISYKDCEAFIRKLNEKTGKNFRMPTEAKWEYAARGGSRSKGYTYAGSNNIDEVAWYERNSNNEIHPVAQKQPNELGLYDMTGNVGEWCYDWYDSYRSSVRINPIGSLEGSERVLRGGNWFTQARYCRSTYRNTEKPSKRYNGIGLRLAL